MRKLTIVMHDCCHGTLFSSRLLNRYVGMLSAGFLFSSFAGYCSMHWEHHRHCGTSKDNFDGEGLAMP